MSRLLPFVRAIPQLCWHRKDFSILRPIVRNDAESLDDLKATSYYVAGTIDSSLANKAELYDVLVSLNDRRVTVAPHAIEEMRMNSAHKEMASLVAEVCESGSNEEIIHCIATKTTQIIDQLKSLGSPLSEEILIEKVSNDSSRSWLLRLAFSENLI